MKASQSLVQPMDAFGLDHAPKSLRLRLRRRTLAAGAMLFRQGDPAAAVYVIEQGRIAMVRHTPEGRRVTLFTAGPSESFAEAALFSEVYHCDAVAEVPARVIVVPKLELRRVLARQRRLADQLMARLAHQVQDLRLRLELRNIRSARERVWQALLVAAGATSRTVTFDRPLKVVADEMGLTHEAFYRTLATLARTGRIRRRGRRIDLLTGI
jgi:CRP-like cAMP-binding protein